MSKRTKILSAVCVALFGLICANWINQKNKPIGGSKSKDGILIEQIEFAKRRAMSAGTLKPGQEITYNELRKYLGNKPMPKIVMGKYNGTGKNLHTWGTTPSEDGPGQHAQLSYALTPTNK